MFLMYSQKTKNKNDYFKLYWTQCACFWYLEKTGSMANLTSAEKWILYKVFFS